jgi:MFS transporter, PAT family, beta-lactamase induction signal transducer AmpG
MSRPDKEKRTWSETFSAWLHPRVVAMLFLGFSAGIPFSLIFFTLSIWLSEAGVNRGTVTFFSWASLGYSFKFIWAPLVDRMPLPFLTPRFGRRRSWLLASQVFIIAAIIWMALVNPGGGGKSLTCMAMAAVLLGFAAATQDIVIDAYRIECVETSLQAMLSSMYIAGYRIGMLAAGAGALLLASSFGTSKGAYHYSAWCSTYLVMAVAMVAGVITSLLIPEPDRNSQPGAGVYSTWQYMRFLGLFLLASTLFAITFFFSASEAAAFKNTITRELSMNMSVANFFVETCRLVMALVVAGLGIRAALLAGLVDRQMVFDTYVDPVRDFFGRYGGRTAILLLTLIGFYKLSDIVLGIVSNIFYLDMGFSKNVIAGVTKVYGVGMTIFGGFLGGMLTLRFGVYRILFLGAFLSAASNLLFMLLAGSSADVSMLTLVIAVDNLSGGIAATAFVAFLSSLTNISFTAVQYALFSSMMTLFPKVIGGYSGEIVTSWGYELFFLLTAVMGVPVLVLVWMTKDIVETE